MKYLYGASVQGIQNFIFETNKLKEIVGASELVEQICTSLFKEVTANFNEDNLIMGAAGNIKYIFENITDCQSLVRIFPKIVMEKAPGITISQAIVQFEGSLQKEDIDKLEEKLRTQRNKPIIQHGLGMMISERSRRTGKPGIKWKGKKGDKAALSLGEENKDNASQAARGKLLEKIIGQNHDFKDRYPTDMKDIVKQQDREWIAVVHADGNNLGKTILSMAKQLKPEHTQAAFRAFSEKLGRATEKAASDAFYDVIQHRIDDKEYLPIRPVVLGGDDLTIIIRGDLALDYTESFLKAFEIQTKNEFEGFGKTYELNNFNISLTACAGIAYIKPNYPFHYGVKLSEGLCSHSKKIAKELNKNRTPSCLTFHKVQSSFIDDYKDIIEQELTTKLTKVQFNYGPYFLNHQEGYGTVEKLKHWTKEIKRKDAPKASLRNWLSALQTNPDMASQQLQRISSINRKRYITNLALGKNEIFTERSSTTYTHIFDVMTLASIEKK